jgi:hypothetical protein
MASRLRTSWRRAWLKVTRNSSRKSGAERFDSQTFYKRLTSA